MNRTTLAILTTALLLGCGASRNDDSQGPLGSIVAEPATEAAPSEDGPDDLPPGPLVQIETDRILARAGDGPAISVMTLAGGRTEAPDRFLLEALRDELESWERGDALTVIAAPEVPYRTFSQVMYTAARVGRVEIRYGLIGESLGPPLEVPESPSLVRTIGATGDAPPASREPPPLLSIDVRPDGIRVRRGGMMYGADCQSGAEGDLTLAMSGEGELAECLSALPSDAAPIVIAGRDVPMERVVRAADAVRNRFGSLAFSVGLD